MIKKLASISMLFAVLAVTAYGQTPVTSKATWAEKDEFHKVMAQTYHPSEEGNFEPIRNRIGEMHDKAVAWMNSTPPADFDKPEIKATLKEMLGQIIALKAMIDNKATNEELKPKMEALHDTFHKIVGLCKKDDHHGGDRHDPAGEHKH